MVFRAVLNYTHTKRQTSYNLRSGLKIICCAHLKYVPIHCSGLLAEIV